MIGVVENISWRGIGIEVGICMKCGYVEALNRGCYGGALSEELCMMRSRSCLTDSGTC